ncbi:hypothetical protein [Aquirhabdus sp.]|uniref:hypothetical protein n=1 Tax=Aquirhabdus sp. TaxID=2824160 RepID=UPI00396CD8D4
MARVVTKIGDIFEVSLGDGRKKYLQYIISDLMQLNSDVIRVFKQTYQIEDKPDLEEVVKGDVDFYCHTTTSAGIKMGLWTKAGKSNDVGTLDLLFRGAKDSSRKPEEPVKKISNDWYIWRANDEQFTYVGKLEGSNRKAELGSVYPPFAVIQRIITGDYGMYYPDYE